MSKKSLIATTIAGILAFSVSNIATADGLNNLQKSEARIFKASQKSQKKIDNIYEQTQNLIAEYRNVSDEGDVLREYNNHVQRMVNDQQRNIDSLQSQIDGIDKIKQGVVPLMYKMIDTLEKFVNLDIPVNLEARKARIANLKKVMGNSNVTTSEQFRLVLEAYQIEAGYGSMFSAYQGELNLGDRTITADFVFMGRISFLAESLDLKHAWVWDNETRSWKALDDAYLNSVTNTVRMARKQLPINLTKIPVFAAGAE